MTEFIELLPADLFGTVFFGEVYSYVVRDTDGTADELMCCTKILTEGDRVCLYGVPYYVSSIDDVTDPELPVVLIAPLFS